MNSLIRYPVTELSAWSPFNRLSTLHEELDNLFNLAFPSFSRRGGLFESWTPALDMSQDKDNIYVKVELPGMKKEDFQISLHEGVLTISGERKQETEKQEGEVFRSERFFGKFQRSVALPVAVDAAKIKATYKEGILAITLPKVEEAKPKQIQVSVS